uniref:Uncharacterized protein n=1 Tax=Ditylenchus dipsaci TaxID=166011 RepID=A0A915DX56_9BILA
MCAPLDLSNKPIHRHSHPMALVDSETHLESQQPRSYSLKSGVLTLKKKPQPKTSVQLPGVCCAAAQDKRPEKQRMRFGSTSSIPAVMFRPHHAGRAMSRRSCGAVNEGLRMAHEQVGERKSGSSTASAPFASCNCCARCNHLMFMYSLVGSLVLDHRYR